MNPSRREAIEQLALLCGLTCGGTAISALAQEAASPTDMSRSTRRLFDKSQLALLREICETIIPATDTPGAIAAGVHEFIDRYAAHCATKEQQRTFLDTLKRIDTSAQNRFHQRFSLLGNQARIELLTSMEQASSGFDHNDRRCFKQLKGWVIFGYYTSEVGASQELAYLSTPGSYKGDFKFETVGRAWALIQ